jgi:mannose-6-phosphate isomerase-like protein (cupin superfamily)
MTTNLRAPATLATVVDGAAIALRPWLPLPGFEGVTYKLLWQSGKSVAGIMRIAPDGEVSSHAHQRSHHHLWVIDGSAEMLGRRVAQGSYVHVPAGVEHGITAPGVNGCTVLYLYLREGG